MKPPHLPIIPMRQKHDQPALLAPPLLPGSHHDVNHDLQGETVPLAADQSVQGI